MSNFLKKENYVEDERVSNTSFHSLKYSPTGEYNTFNEPISNLYQIPNPN